MGTMLSQSQNDVELLDVQVHATGVSRLVFFMKSLYAAVTSGKLKEELLGNVKRNICICLSTCMSDFQA